MPTTLVVSLSVSGKETQGVIVRKLVAIWSITKCFWSGNAGLC